MHSLFLDANVFFAAVCSGKGASNYIFQLAKSVALSIVTNEYALKEAKINIEKKLGKDKLPDFYKLVVLLDNVDTKKVTAKQIISLKNIIIAKDIPILASAINMKVDFLVTLDKKDFMSKKMLAENFPFEIVTPGKYLVTKLDS